MASTARTGSKAPSGRRRRDPGVPKGRPTPGRKQRNATARARARRRRLQRRLWWSAAFLLLVGLIALFIVTGAGSGTTPALG